MNDKTNHDDFDNWLAGELRNRDDYIEDDGFSRQVMARLPAAPARRKLTFLVWFGWVLLAVVASLVWYPPLAATLLSLAGWAAAVPAMDVMQLLYIGAGVTVGVCSAVATLLWWDSARPV